MLLIKSQNLALVQFGTKKWRTVLNNYKADMYETWQLWLERDIVYRISFSFSICSIVFKLRENKVTLLPNCGAKWADFRPSKYRGY